MKLWLPRVGWLVIALLMVFFIWGLRHRSQLEMKGQKAIQMLFVPSVEQGTLVRRGDELARFVRADSGLTLRSQVPTSYAAVIQALGAGQADVAWIPAFAYVLANARYGAEARLQVVRSVDRYSIVITRVRVPASRNVSKTWSTSGSPCRRRSPAVSARRSSRFSTSLPRVGRGPGRQRPTRRRCGCWSKDRSVDAAASRHVYSGPHDLVGDGRKELEYDRPGNLRETRVIHTSEQAQPELSSVYYGCVMTRTDSGINRLEDLNGSNFGSRTRPRPRATFSPGHCCSGAGWSWATCSSPGGHPNVVQAVRDGKVSGGAPSTRRRRPPTSATAPWWAMLDS